MTIVAYADFIGGACGVGIIYDFQNQGPDYRRDPWDDSQPINTINGNGGAGWELIGFINTKLCKKAYNRFKQRFPIVYQSEVRTNINSGNEFFFIMCDRKSKDKTLSKASKWPWAVTEEEEDGL